MARSARIGSVGVEAVAANGDFDPNTDRYFNPAAWTDPVRSSSGTRPGETDRCADFPNYSEDLNIFKVFPMADQRKLRFEASIGNLFNRYLLLRTQLEPSRLWHGQHAV